MERIDKINRRIDKDLRDDAVSGFVQSILDNVSLNKEVDEQQDDAASDTTVSTIVTTQPLSSSQQKSLITMLNSGYVGEVRHSNPDYN
eukprot:4314122-Pleurochrysis_carterae.AAC.1